MLQWEQQSTKTQQQQNCRLEQTTLLFVHIFKKVGQA